ncbi:hypothetical protein [Spongiivirga citrea]|uniref:Uncharacterized protein n=1 Tax=Spongiivirga citrea TaxID=1481457 RepID=A0A6M0CQ70_9FLAO|nr:hypothetical protein [Spongiivirga citrea]NER19063.1 hypothetical protein [Spongiivirga citrea]
MKTRFKIIAYVVGVLLFAVACTEEAKKNIKDAKQVVSATTSYAKDVTSMQKEIERLQKLTPVTNEQLKAWLPESVGNLNRTGFKIGQGAYMKISMIEGTYMGDDRKKKINITIMDGAGPTGSAMVPGYGLLGNFETEVEDERKHLQTVTVNGIKAKQTYYKKRNGTQLMFIYNKRFIVTVNSNNMDVDETWGAVKKMQLNKLEN